MGTDLLNLGKLVVIDLESTCWKGPPPPEQRNEIIEIGVSLLNISTLEVSHPRRIFVRPFCSEISSFCTELTGITKEVIDAKGKPFNEALDILFKEYHIDSRVWAGWGNDGKELKDAATKAYVSHLYSFSESYINLCSLFSVMVGSPNRVGLDRALAMAGLQFEGRRHAGGDDAYNAARAVRWLIEKIRRPA